MIPSSRFSSDFRLFGLDLSAGAHGLTALWAQVLDGPPFSWAVRPVAVRLLRADGAVQVWCRGDQSFGAEPHATANSIASPARYWAVEIPDDFVLRHRCTMPAMPAAPLAQAVLLELRSISPFAPEALVCGWVLARDASGRTVVDAAMVARPHLERLLADAVATLGMPLANLEVWALPAPLDDQGRSASLSRPGMPTSALPATRAPIVLRGFGESIRQSDLLRQRRRGYALLGFAAVLACAIALTPTIQLWLRSEEARVSFDQVQQRTRPAVALRERFLASSQSLTALDSAVGESAAPLRVLDVLTTALPDDTYVQSVEITGTKVSFSGLTDNAAALMTRLGETPGVRDLRASQPATRQIGAAKESFGIEFRLDIPGVVPRSAELVAAAAVKPIAVPDSNSSANQNNQSNMPSAPVPQEIIATKKIAIPVQQSTAVAAPYYPPGLAPVEQAPAGSSASSGSGMPPAAGSPPALRASVGGSARPPPAPPPASAPSPKPAPAS